MRLGVKIYDNAWFLQHGFSPEGIADWLAELGVTFVITQSRYLPMADNAVASAVRDGERTRYAQLDDIDFRRALGTRAIAYFACLNIGLDPAFAADHPELLSVDQFGEPMRRTDWYIGTSPDRAGNIAHKAGLLAGAAAALAPDGIHLGFVRWPGFWETWLPDVARDHMPEYGFDRLSLKRFCADTGADVPLDDPIAAARRIYALHRSAWRDWKCGVVVAAIGALRTAVHGVAPGLPFAINTLPFLRADYDNAVEEVFGQDISRLADVVDIFEVMAYHQILRRGPEWPAAVAADIKARSQGRRTIATLQAEALYLSGMHEGRGRKPVLDSQEFSAAVTAIERSPVDGLCLFTLTDLLAMRATAEGIQKLERVKRFRA